VPGIIGGTTKASWAFTEPQTGSDPKQMTTRAEHDGNGWVLHGEKTFITLAPLADYALVFAKTPDDRLSAILIDTRQPGWQPSTPFEFVAFGGAATSAVHLDGVRAPMENLVGLPGQGFEILLRVEAAGKIRAAATCVGIAQRAQELAVAYALSRTHRGEPIGKKFESIQWLIGEIGASVEAARALTREAARRHDRGESIQRLAAATRIVAARTARTVTSDALQVFGSYGMVRGSEIERLYREAKFFEVGQGVVELQRLIVARSLLAEASTGRDRA
jgi:alkylation response protein AidB-like acyl-CoA dehydrogenase